ncbi:MAG TPA: serine/threonine-protein kinase, partial [Blastocatellia bacterium]|nr:serine/threonine-protein kinase [Blastocatellia bacterium]
VAPVVVESQPAPPPAEQPVEAQSVPVSRTASSLRVTKQCPRCEAQYVERMVYCPRDGQRLERIPEIGEVSFSHAPAPSDNLTLLSEPDPLLGRTIADHYKLVLKIGQGGMGVVYKAEHVRITRPSAIKILNPEYAGNPEFVARFGREAELASRINHPNAVGIYDVGEEEDGLVYIAMEYVDGELLSKIIKREGPLPLERAVNIARQVAEALDAAHELDIVHRDLKPDNIMICKRRGKSDWVKVVDFGIAKRANHGVGYQNLTRRGLVLGTPEYMAPEQLLREPLDTRSDIYSLGLVVYRMLTGKLPFDGPTPQSRMIKKLTEPPLSLRSVRPQLRISPQVEAVIMKALAMDRKNRYQTSLEFAAALERAAESNAVYTVLAGDGETAWLFDEAETEASETPFQIQSLGERESTSDRREAQTILPPENPPDLAPSESMRPNAPDAMQEGGRPPEPQQAKAPESPQPAFAPAAQPPPAPQPAFEQPKVPYPPAPKPPPPPTYDQNLHPPMAAYQEGPYYRPPDQKQINWKLIVTIIILLVSALGLLLIAAFWMSGANLTF